MTFKLPLLALTILALALAGCGSSDSSNGGSDDAAAPEPLTKTELIAQADAICKEMQTKIDAIKEPESIDQLANAIDEQIELSGPAIKELQALTPPENLATQYESWTDKLDQLQTETEKIRDAAKSGSEEQVNEIVSGAESINTEADKIGKEIGFKVCAQ